ncbi:MAG: diaminopimelate epimerase [Chloroflexi bacterium 13_1_40CM_68_21]|nr:MAG: diaminopimelate epimerase [Chloroflexi bacterium 13_1_40CM_68_21]
MKFTKMHGCGNDFLVVDGPAELDVPRVREICDRRRGVGADGILVIGAPEGRRWPVILHNADGSLGESCGNGARCVARYLLDRHGGDVLNLRFAGGDVSARREGDCIAITLGAPTRPEPVAVDGVRRAYLMNVGNRHVVLLVEDPATIDLPAVAATVRGVHGDVNVEVARVLNAGLIAMRVDERGVGETQACGTGACAAVAAAACEHRMEDTVRVQVSGGELLVRRRAGRDTFELAGPAEYAFEGRVD